MKKWYLFQLKKINLFFAKKRANNLHKLTGRQYFVIPAKKNKLLIVDNKFILSYNKFIKNKAVRKITIVELLKMSYYFTSNSK